MKFAAPLPPDWRWERVQQALKDKIPPEDPFILAVYSVCEGLEESTAIQEALYLYHVPYERDVIISFLLSGATVQQVHYGLGISAEILANFETLFMDRKTFKNKIEWRLYAQYYLANKVVPEAKQMLQAGMSHGPSVLMDHWTMGNDVMEIPEREILSRWAMTAYTKSLVARDCPITSLEAREAFKWGAMAIKSVSELRNTRAETGDTQMDALLAIEKRRVVVPPKELGISLTDIGH
jgi:hypothetical protein